MMEILFSLVGIGLGCLLGYATYYIYKTELKKVVKPN